MSQRPVTLFTGQWADLKIAELLPKVKAMGYEGVELACWGDHFDVDAAANSKKYVHEKWAMLKDHGLTCYAISSHLVGQAIGAGGMIAARHQVFHYLARHFGVIPLCRRQAAFDGALGVVLADDVLVERGDDRVALLARDVAGGEVDVDAVEGASFSTGGFAPKYGDRTASVTATIRAAPPWATTASSSPTSSASSLKSGSWTVGVAACAWPLAGDSAISTRPSACTRPPSRSRMSRATTTRRSPAIAIPAT